MVCGSPVHLYTFDRSLHGVRTVFAHGDGYSYTLTWNQYYANPINWDIVYNIYWSTNFNDVFAEGVKFVVPGTQLRAVLRGGFKLGSIYYFAIRASGHEPGTFNIANLPQSDGLYMYPEAALREDISPTDTIIPVDDASLFPPSGIILIGAEIIGYSSLDLVNNNLILSNVSQRGLYGYEPRIHTTDGYDGYHSFDNPFVSLWRGFEDSNTVIGLDENKFEDQYAHTIDDGYKERVDIVTGGENLTVVEDANDGFPAWDNAGWDRNHMTDYLAGKCVGTYFGGEWGCAESDSSEGPERGLGIQDHINMREEYLLEITGFPVMLFRRMWEGKTSRHYDSTRENTIYRGIDNHGTSLVSGYEQFFNSRRSDGRILVSFGPTKEDIKREDAGLENTFIPNCWTLVTPAVKDGDFIIRYNADGSEEWRYEIIDVERNSTILEGFGAQKFTAVRVRKTDPIYQVRSISDTSMFPSEVLTGIGSVSGPGGIPPHMHRIVVNEGILSVSQINQMSSIEQGHNHAIINGVVQEVLGHSHDIILP